MKLTPSTKKGLKIAGVVLVTLLGLAPLPLLALPYGALDWAIYDPSYKSSQGYPPEPAPTVDVRQIPCAELPAPGEPVAAWVNGQGIGLAAFEREMAQFLASLEALGMDLGSAEVQAQFPVYRRQVSNLMIDDVLVQQAAFHAGITVTDGEIQAQVSEQVSQGGGTESFNAWLNETGQTYDEFERDVCQDILRQRVMDHVTAGIAGPVEMVWARQIVVGTEQEGVDTLTRLASGEQFVVVAWDVSLDQETRDDGGDLGWFPRGVGRTAHSVEEAVFAGEPGQVQGPLPVGEQYYVVQTLEFQADRSLDPEMIDALRVSTFDQWLTKQKEAAEIEILIDLDSPPQ